MPTHTPFDRLRVTAYARRFSYIKAELAQGDSWRAS